NVLCNGGSTGAIDLSVVGGSGSYTYLWTGTGVSASAEDQTELAAGVYKVIVTDSNGCSSSELSITLTENPEVNATETTTSHIDVNCFGGTSGAFTVVATGGAGTTYTYSLSSDFSNSNATGVFTGLAAGTYTVYVKDVNECTDPSPIQVIITQPLTLSATVNSLNVSCNGNEDGSITITTPAGGSGTYEYSIDGGSNWQSTGNFTGLAANTYNVQIRDAVATGCVITLTGSLTITEPLAINLQVSSTDVLCFGQANGTITASAAQGSTITVNGQPYNSNMQYGPGQYLIRAEALGGNYNQQQEEEPEICFEEKTITITQPEQIIVSAGSNKMITCKNPTVQLIGTVTSSGNYTYSWTTTNGIIDSGVSSLNPIVSAPGTYILTVTDVNTSCSASGSVVVSQNILKPTITLNATTNELSCNVKSITINSQISSIQGTPSYLWSKDLKLISGATSSSLVVTEPGEYLVVVTDSYNGCIAAQKVVITENIQNSEVSITGNVELTCSNETTTLTALAIVQGTASYLWNTGATT
ncbi:SprB repeat-containing protein, partial [Lutibacter maritimus]